MKNKIWWDITNVPHVSFLKPFMNLLQDEYDYLFSIRDFAETRTLFEMLINKPYILLGDHKGSNKLMKVFGVFQRTWLLQKNIDKFDVKISVGGDSSNLVAKIRGKKSITFDDNEKAPNWRYSHFSDFAFWPKCVDVNVLYEQGFKKNKLYQYNGYKEDIYLADYIPDETFLSTLPFKKYVVLRPENIRANYVNGENLSIVPTLIDLLSDLGYNILFLPRYESDREYASNRDNIYIPDSAINGMDACYFADAVLTGAGTMAREAACLGVPAFSFYAGKELLTVDQSLINEGKMFFSRSPKEIISKLKTTKRGDSNLAHCKLVQMEVKDKLKEVLNGFK